MVVKFLRLVKMILAVSAIPTFLLMSPAMANEPAFIKVGAGYYDIDNNKSTSELHLEYLSNHEWELFRPFAGVMMTGDSAFYSYGGVRFDLISEGRLAVTPGFAAGLYNDGDGKDLGHLIVFRAAVDVTYRMKNHARIGMSLYHLTNLGLGNNNPGIETITFNYSYPLDD